MIKAVGRTIDGRPMLILGLSGENMTRLMAGEPIMIDTDLLGHPFAGLPSLNVLLLGGRTEDNIVQKLTTMASAAAAPDRTPAVAVPGPHACPTCHVERTDFEGPGWHLPTCPNCRDTADPLPIEAARATTPTRYRCPVCTALSCHREDARAGYCGRCSNYTRSDV